MARRNYKYKRNTYQSSQAMRHIEEAKVLTKQLGGTDQDVKAWFFNLTGITFENIMQEYKQLHGIKAYDYAIQTIPSWRSGQRQMSGMVAERLFNLIPKHMPLEDKFKLVDSLWKFTTVSKKMLIRANKSTEINELVALLQNEVNRIETDWEIPDNLSNRFVWLAGDDSTTYQKLLSHIVDQERQLIAAMLPYQVTELLSHYHNEWSETSNYFSHTVEVGKHTVEVRITDQANELTVGQWYAHVKPYTSTKGSGCLGILALMLIIPTAIITTLL
ncbi:hypothetical protein PQE20_27065 (plasmid) [Vibrio harveyi]|uniref:hypothetical protein n=1 Tax=Vibrio harveyi TaxID=669 RepID=UPI00234C70B7|nr:hypothetical protein [Vibrio harveyi]WCP84168.1 hypothetical protein PQE20_27065 [Vibrio harveyi]